MCMRLTVTVSACVMGVDNINNCLSIYTRLSFGFTLQSCENVQYMAKTMWTSKHTQLINTTMVMNMLFFSSGKFYTTFWHLDSGNISYKCQWGQALMLADTVSPELQTAFQLIPKVLDEAEVRALCTSVISLWTVFCTHGCSHVEIRNGKQVCEFLFIKLSITNHNFATQGFIIWSSIRHLSLDLQF